LRHVIHSHPQLFHKAQRAKSLPSGRFHLKISLSIDFIPGGITDALFAVMRVVDILLGPARIRLASNL
jgi:hypothetical protein